MWIPSSDGLTVRWLVVGSQMGTEDALRSAFLKIGAAVRDVYIPTDRVTKRFYGTVFINFESPAEAALAVACHGMLLCGRPVRVEFSPYKRKTPGGPGGGRGGRGGPAGRGGGRGFGGRGGGGFFSGGGNGY